MVGIVIKKVGKRGESDKRDEGNVVGWEVFLVKIGRDREMVGEN